MTNVLKLALVLLFQLLFSACLKDFNNPIDPENEGAVPPSPFDLKISLIPYEDTRVYRGTFEFSWENSSGVLVERSGEDAEEFEIIDTLFFGQREFADTRSMQDTIDYGYRLVAFNENGLSGYTKFVRAVDSDSLDLFPPQVKPWLNNNPLADFITVKDSVLHIRFKVFDESPLASFVVNEEDVPFTIERSGWVDYYDTLKSYTNTYRYTVQDESEFERITQDSFVVYFDYPNQSPHLQMDNSGADLELFWSEDKGSDFMAWHLYLEKAGALLPTDESGNVILAGATLTDHVESIILQDSLSVDSENSVQSWVGDIPEGDFQLRIVLIDSAENVVSGPNSVIRRVNGLWHRHSAVWIEGGTFVDANGNSGTVTQGFWMDTTEITRTHYQNVLDYLPGFFTGAQNPADGVSWLDAILFCNARSIAENLDTVYSYDGIAGTHFIGLQVNWDASGYRLPTADEWELAARAGKDSAAWFWGDDNAHAKVDQYAWYSRNAGGVADTLPRALENGPQRVAYKFPNDYGLYDIAGNIGEWVWDYYTDDFNLRADGRSDYRGPEQCTEENGCLAPADVVTGTNDRYRIYKGGSWIQGVNSLGVSDQTGSPQHVKSWMTGLRPVRNFWPKEGS